MPGYTPPGGGSDMSGSGTASGYPGSGAGGFGPSGQPQGAQPTAAVSLSPGIVMLGIVSAKDLREKAQKAGVDAVCVFNVVVTVIPRLQTDQERNHDSRARSGTGERTVRIEDVE